MTPVPKVAAAGLAGAVSVILVWILNALAIDVPPAVASAFTTVIAFAAGYIKQPS